MLFSSFVKCQKQVQGIGKPKGDKLNIRLLIHQYGLDVSFKRAEDCLKLLSSVKVHVVSKQMQIGKSCKRHSIHVGRL